MLKKKNLKLIVKIHFNCVNLNMQKVHKGSTQAYKLYSEDVHRLRRGL